MDTSFRTEYLWLNGVRIKVQMDDVPTWINHGWMLYTDHQSKAKKEAEEKMERAKLANKREIA